MTYEDPPFLEEHFGAPNVLCMHISTSEEVKVIREGEYSLAEYFKAQGKKGKSKYAKEKWKVRRPCSFLCGNCSGVLSAESASELTLRVTFVKAFRCSAFSFFVNTSLK